MPDPSRETPEELLRLDRRRRRRWRRAWGAIGLVLLLLVAVRAWWGHMADRRLQAVIDRYHAAGEPILIADFAPTKLIADTQNAALVYEDAAIAVVVPTGVEVKGEYFVQDPRLAFAYPQDSRLWVEANDPLLALLRKADALPDCDWGVRFASPMVLLVWPNVAFVRSLDQTICSLAVAEHVTGDDATCMECLAHAQRLAHHLVTPRDSFLIQYFVATACEARLCRSVEAVASKLKVSDSADQASSAQVRPASREQVKKLIHALLDDEAWDRGWTNAMNGERASLLDTARALPSGNLAGVIGGPGPISARALDLAIGPTVRLDAAAGLESITRLRDAALLDCYPAAARVVATVSDPPPFMEDDMTLDQAAHMLSRMMMPSLGSTVSRHFRLRAERRMAATALAIRLYELEHGKRPATLDELVPELLPAVPVDPFAEPGRPLMYLPGNDPPILYSVSEDGVDDGGVEHPGRPGGRTKGGEGDLLFYLKGDRSDDPIRWENVLVNPPKNTGDSADED